MKKIILFTALFVTAYSVWAAGGKIQKSESEQNGNPPPAAINYDRDCNGNGKPRGMASTITVVASGVGNVTTIQELDGASGVPGTNVYTTTVDTSVANTTTTSCAGWVQQ